MICYNCGYQVSSDDINQCPLCGMKFPVSCQSCDAPNPVMAKYCFNCGTEIIKSDLQSTIKNFDILSESRKNVAVMFADVSGFTAFSEKLDPEEVREIINDVFNYITKPVYELEGTIDKYIGDCVMILFGAKYHHSDDPKRAVMCGIEMQKLIKEFSVERLSNKGVSLDLSIGINYGLVVTGSVGNYFDKDYTVMGDVVNTAQRLQTVAEKGTILVSESVFTETKDVIDYSNPKELTVKNKKKPIKVYLPIDEKAEASLDNVLLVERETELNLLNSILINSNNTKSVTVIGDAGIGKTSLIHKFISSINKDTKKVWVTCNPIYQNRVYFIISSILFNLMNINIDDSNRIKGNRLKSYIDYLLKDYNYTEDEMKKNYNFLSLIMGLDRDKEFQKILNAMNYDDLQREILYQLSVFFTNLYKKQQFIFIIDDIQWADSSSIRLIKQLLNMLSELKSMFIFASRYELEELASIEEDKNHIIKLKKLIKSGTHNLVRKLLNCSTIDNDLLEAILKFTDGNPHHIKEYVKAINRKDTLTVKNGIAYVDKSGISSLPNTIESLILANISELDDAAKSLLQIASVIGKEFCISWVDELFDNTIGENIIKSPIKLNIISFKSVQTSTGIVEKVYEFNQDTVREVIYGSILNKNKKELHNKIAELIESRYKNELENYYEILCTHFELAGISKKAEEYYYKTAIKHKNDFNYKSALKYFNKFLKLTENTIDSRVISALIDIGNIYTNLDHYEQALEYLKLALQKANLSDDTYSIKIMIANIYKEMGMYTEAISSIEEIQPKIRQNTNIYGKLLQLKCSIFSITGNSEALELAKKSEEILLKTKDYENLIETLSQAGVIHFINGDVDDSLYYLKNAYQYAERISDYKGMDRISGNLGIIFHATGMVSKAQEYFNKSIEISKKISNQQGYMTSNINLGILYMDKGLFKKAEALYFESLKISQELSSKLYECIALTNLGDLMYENGDYNKSLEFYTKSLDIAKKHGLPVEEGINYIGLIKINLKLKAYDNIIETLEKAFKLFNDANEILYISDYYRFKSILELKNRNYDAALEYCNKSLSLTIESKNDMKKLKVLRLKGNIFIRLENPKKAIELYRESINLAEQLESDYEIAKGYYRKYLLLNEINRNDEANINLLKANEAINRVDECRWKSKINSPNN